MQRRSTSSKDWEPFARLVLKAAYEATLAISRCKADESGKFMRAEMQRLIDKHFN